MLRWRHRGSSLRRFFNFIGLWNEFQLALIFIKTRPAPAVAEPVFAEERDDLFGRLAGLFAGVVIVIVPTVVLVHHPVERMISADYAGSVEVGEAISF